MPPLSLPFLFQTRLDTIPASNPYLHASPEKTREWSSKLVNKGKCIRIGLVWQGNPRFENDADRSIASIDILRPLASIPGVHYFSLQKGLGEAQLNNLDGAWRMTALGSQITDFADTAAIIANLDLVISVDTAVAHLAGALGKSCWLLLPDYQTDWRWLDHRDDSPWYPGKMRLFRQTAGASWQAVIEEVREALAATVKSLHRR